MKIRLLLAITGLAIGFAVPAFAQQKDTVDPQIIQQVDAIGMKNDEAFNKNDAAAVAALFTEDAVLVSPRGPVYGQKAIEKWHADLFQKWHFSNHITKADPNSPHITDTAGNHAWWIGEWSDTIQGQNGPSIDLKGYYSVVGIREGDAWKVRVLTYNVFTTPESFKSTATGSATPSPTTTPSKP
jgi:ketosteroid isomerase-like protein